MDFETWWADNGRRDSSTYDKYNCGRLWQAAVEATKAACVEAVLDSDKIVYETQTANINIDDAVDAIRNAKV